jgi:hypothetical protein
VGCRRGGCGFEIPTRDPTLTRSVGWRVPVWVLFFPTNLDPWEAHFPFSTLYHRPLTPLPPPTDSRSPLQVVACPYSALSTFLTYILPGQAEQCKVDSMAALVQTSSSRVVDQVFVYLSSRSTTSIGHSIIDPLTPQFFVCSAISGRSLFSLSLSLFLSISSA